MMTPATERAPEMAAGTILVVDDEVKVCDLLRVYLERSGYAVLCASDGRAAVMEHERHKPDLVLLDLNLDRKSVV